MPDVIGHLLGLRGYIMLKAISVRDMVRGDESPLGFICFPLHFFVKEEQAVGADAPLLGVSQKKCSGLLWGSLVAPSSLIQTHPFAGRTVGRHKFVHESSAGLTPKPRGGYSDREKRCPVGSGMTIGDARSGPGMTRGYEILSPLRGSE